MAGSRRRAKSPAEEWKAAGHCRAQETLLDSPKELPGLRYGHLYRSATQGARVGGDFYDVFEVKAERLVVLIGDVSGHGVEAARIATLVKDVVNALSHQFRYPRLVLDKTNDLLIGKEIPGFVTIFLGIMDPQTRVFTYSFRRTPQPPAPFLRPIVTPLRAAAPAGVFPGSFVERRRTSLDKQELLLLLHHGGHRGPPDGEFFGQAAGRCWSMPGPNPRNFLRCSGGRCGVLRGHSWTSALWLCG